jgi:HAE1 family hydrophobic/amphiphilic exporter-1
VIGGLITSTLLTLVVVPVVYTILDDFGSRVRGWVLAWTSPPSGHEAREPAEPPPVAASPALAREARRSEAAAKPSAARAGGGLDS